MPVPDLAGFREAQDRLIDLAGTPCDFHTPGVLTWPADVAIDPETGDPYDPTAVPDAPEAPTVVTKKCSVISGVPRVTTDRSDTFNPFGWVNDTRIALKLPAADYPDVKDATTVTVYGVDYAIHEWREVGLDIIDSYYALVDRK